MCSLSEDFVFPKTRIPITATQRYLSFTGCLDREWIEANKRVVTGNQAISSMMFSTAFWIHSRVQNTRGAQIFDRKLNKVVFFFSSLARLVGAYFNLPTSEAEIKVRFQIRTTLVVKKFPIGLRFIGVMKMRITRAVNRLPRHRHQMTQNPAVVSQLNTSPNPAINDATRTLPATHISYCHLKWWHKLLFHLPVPPRSP